MKLQYKQPVTIMSAIQLRDMPLQEMLWQIEAQENQAIKDKTMGRAASDILEKVRQGGVVEYTEKGGRKFFTIAGVRAEPRAVRQLINRGYLVDTGE